MKGRELLIGVTGGIAAYKTAALVSQLVQAGAGVSVVMTRGHATDRAKNLRGADWPPGGSPRFRSGGSSAH